MKSQYEIHNDGNMFMDAPYHENFEDLVTLANDKAFWKSQESNIPSHLRGPTMHPSNDNFIVYGKNNRVS